MDSILLQKQVRDNAEELRGILQDLKSWETDMKRKDSELRGDFSEGQALPPVRNKIKRVKQDEKSEVNGKEHVKPKRISSYDYSSWDKFDVDKACNAVDLEGANEDSNDNLLQTDEDDSLEKREQAMYEKEMGNQYVKKQKWKEAIPCYNRAIECYPFDSIFYANRALCYLKTNNLKSAEVDCTSSLQLDGSYVKAYQRRAAARIGLGQHQEAKADLEKVLELEPLNSASKAELEKLVKKMNPNKQKEKKNQESTISIKKAVVEPSKESKSSLKIINKEKKHDGSGDFDTSLESWGNNEANLVQPINKLPHLRSKKPMKRIEIQEISNELEYIRTEGNVHTIPHSGKSDNVSPSTSSASNIQIVISNDEMKEKVDLEHIKENTTHVIKQPVSDSKESDVTVQKQNIVPSENSFPCKQVEINTEKSMEQQVPPVTKSSVQPVPSENSLPCKQVEINTDKSIEQQVPPVPKSSVQFLVAWKKVRSEPKLRFLYLKNIAGKDFPQIFQDSLESDVLSDVLSALRTDFLPLKEEIYPYILGLSKVRRFSTLTMFMSAVDKEGIKELLNHCEKSGECSQDEILLIAKKYEL